jgi:hypothetical protein
VRKSEPIGGERGVLLTTWVGCFQTSTNPLRKVYTCSVKVGMRYSDQENEGGGGQLWISVVGRKPNSLAVLHSWER